MLPAAAIVCVLFGTGLVEVAELAPAGLARWAVLALLIGSSIALSAGRFSALHPQEVSASQAAQAYRELSVAIRRAGGRRALYPCASSVVTMNHTAETALSWKLGVHLSQVKPASQRSGGHLRRS